MTSWRKFWNRLWFLAKQLIPTPSLLMLIFLGIVITIVGAFWELGWLVCAIYYLLLLSIVATDVLSIRQYQTLKVSRKIDQLFELAQYNRVKLEFHTEVPLYTKMWIQDDYPQGFSIDQRTLQLSWSGENKQTISYQTKPHRRGKHTFHSVHVRVMSRMRLLLFQISLPSDMNVHVYPSLEPTRKVRKGYYHQQLTDMGASVTRSFGTGKEFSHLREYVMDDESRNINWMATARTGKLVSNVYQPEVGQQVAILLDCGRLMGVQDHGRSRLDIALEAVLGFAAIALQRGDEVSFLAFSNEMLRFVPLGRGLGHLQKIVEASFDLEPSYVETDYLCAWEKLAVAHKQKTLVALFTDMTNLSFSETIDPMIKHTQKKHLVLTISMLNKRWEERLQRMPNQETEIYEQLIIEKLIQERKTIQYKWRSRQLVPLDVEPDRLASAVIYKYLEIRRKLSH